MILVLVIVVTKNSVDIGQHVRKLTSTWTRGLRTDILTDILASLM